MDELGRRIGAVALTALAVAGCGGGDGERRDDADPLPFADLIARVPAGERAAVALDVARARAELGLARDASPGGANDGARRLRGLTAATVLNYPIRDDGPLDRAVDPRRVTGLLRADGPPEVLLIATREPWDELRAALGREGWRGDAGGVLERRPDPSARVLRWVAGRDGLVVAAGDPRLARAVRDGRAPVSRELRRLLEVADGPVRAARTGGPGCIDASAVGYSPGAGGGDLEFVVRDVPPRPERLRPIRGRRLPDSYTALSARAVGGRVSVPFSFEAASDPAVQPVTVGLAGPGYYTYAC